MQKRLEFGPALSRVFELYGAHFVPLITYAAAFYVAVALIGTLVAATVIGTGATFGVLAVGGAIGVVALLVAVALLTGAIIHAVPEAERTGTFPRLGQSWQHVTPLIGPLFITTILYILGVLAGLVLLVVPGLVLFTLWAVSAPVVVQERLSGGAALGRSRDLVRGNGWTVFGLLLVVGVLGEIAGSILRAVTEAIFGFNEYVATFAGEFVPGVVTLPLSALLTIVLYEALTGTGPEGSGPPDTLAPGTLPPPPAGSGRPTVGPVEPAAPPEPEDETGHRGPFR